jgi:hypothetical protein
MEIPKEFQRFTRTFWSGSLEIYKTDSEWIDRILPLSSPFGANRSAEFYR